GALKHHYRDRGWALRVPRRVHEILGPASQAAELLASTLGREPTVQEVARELEIEVQDLLDVQEAAHARRLASFDADEAGGGGPAQLDRAFRHAEDRIALSQALVGLSPRERAVLDLYYGQGLSQSVIAERYGVSQMQISRWLAGIVARLRAELL
ncbi:MAG TPA: sigma-70 family RNA polymerase sigma factor, partial [Acidimicrobiales bacterium]